MHCLMSVLTPMPGFLPSLPSITPSLQKQHSSSGNDGTLSEYDHIAVASVHAFLQVITLHCDCADSIDV